MAKYIKHYYVNADAPTSYVTTSTKPKYMRHPSKEIEGLDVKVWLTDSDSVDVMLSEVPDSTTINPVTADGKSALVEITEDQFNSVWTPWSEAQALFHEAFTAEQSGDSDTAAVKREAGNVKIVDATTQIRVL